MMKSAICSICAALVAGGLAVASANAASVTLTTPVNTLNPEGDPVRSSVTVVTLDNQIQLSVRNLLIDPKSTAQNISAIQFGITGGSVTGIASSSATQRIVGRIHKDDLKKDPSGEWFDTGTVDTQWAFDFSSSTVTLNALVGDSADRASHTILGSPNTSSNLYESANGSINGNDGHNPFLAGEVTFVLAATGVSEQTHITEATIFYGTEVFAAPVEFDVPEVPTNSSAVPAPSAVMVGGMLLIGLLGRRAKRRNRHPLTFNEVH